MFARQYGNAKSGRVSSDLSLKYSKGSGGTVSVGA